jgi:hypothetical protein
MPALTREALERLPSGIREAVMGSLDPDPSRIDATLASLRPLRARSPLHRLDRIAAALDPWQDPSSVVRRVLGEVLPAVTGFHPRMVAWGLERQCALLSTESIASGIVTHPRLLGSEARRTAIVAAGNIPAAAPLDLTWSILAGDPVAIKMSSREPLTGAWFAHDIVETLDEGVCAAFSWPGEEVTSTDRLLTWAEDTLAYGSDEGIGSLSTRVRSLGGGRRFLGRAHRLSIAWIPLAGWSIDEIARRLAVDVAIWDQEGCLSPHVAFVANAIDLVELGGALAGALGVLERQLPRGDRSLGERAAVRERLSAIEARGARDGVSCVWSDPGGAWSVGLETSDAPLLPSPLGRTILLRRAPNLREALLVCAPWRGRIQSIGIGDDPGRFAEVVDIVASLGVTRLCALGRMQEPAATWFGEEGRFAATGPVDLDRRTDGAWRSLFEGETALGQ